MYETLEAHKNVLNGGVSYQEIVSKQKQPNDSTPLINKIIQLKHTYETVFNFAELNMLIDC